ncbi:hypothetical protein FXO37_35128 [Capsicum annuum]|nr:hypothetical protein FXO37_35128 [Capsicum annuum]
MKDRHTGRPRGSGFITYVDPTIVDNVIAKNYIINDKLVDTVIAQNHIINDKQIEAKNHLPQLESRDEISIAMEDIGPSHVWNMKYRYWPNNKSRMYLLENTGVDMINPALALHNSL